MAGEKRSKKPAPRSTRKGSERTAVRTPTPRLRPKKPSLKAGASETTGLAESTQSDDVVLIHGQSEDGALQILRKKGETLLAGELRPLEEGKPVQGDVLTLKPRPEMPMLCDVVDEVTIPDSAKAGAKQSMRSAGPARVSNPRFRAGWKSVFGKRSKPN